MLFMKVSSCMKCSKIVVVGFFCICIGRATTAWPPNMSSDLERDTKLLLLFLDYSIPCVGRMMHLAVDLAGDGGGSYLDQSFIRIDYIAC